MAVPDIILPTVNASSQTCITNDSFLCIHACMYVHMYVCIAYPFLSLPPNGVDTMIVTPSSRPARLYTALNLMTHLLPGLIDANTLEVASNALILSMNK